MPAPDASGSTYGNGSAWDTRVVGALIRLLLVAAVLFSLAGVHSYGLFTTPWLLAPLWLAARRAGPTEWFIWILLAAPCAYLSGWFVFDTLGGGGIWLPTMVTLLVVVVFVVSTRTSFPSGFR